MLVVVVWMRVCYAVMSVLMRVLTRGIRARFM